MTVTASQALRLLNIKGSHCSAAQLKKAYKEAALTWHPDKNGNSDEAQERFRAIQEAYLLLKASADDFECSTPLTADDLFSDEFLDFLSSYCKVHMLEITRIMEAMSSGDDNRLVQLYAKYSPWYPHMQRRQGGSRKARHEPGAGRASRPQGDHISGAASSTGYGAPQTSSHSSTDQTHPPSPSSPSAQEQTTWTSSDPVHATYWYSNYHDRYYAGRSDDIRERQVDRNDGADGIDGNGVQDPEELRESRDHKISGSKGLQRLKCRASFVANVAFKLLVAQAVVLLVSSAF